MSSTIKKPQSAYMYFCKSARETVKKENPDLKPKDVMKALGEKWRSLPTDERKPFEDLAENDKKRYRDQLPPKPVVVRKNVSAYIHFSNSVRKPLREANNGITLGELSRLISSKWKELTEEEKEEFKEKARVDKERYEKEVAGMTTPPPADQATETEQDIPAQPPNTPVAPAKKKNKKNGK